VKYDHPWWTMRMRIMRRMRNARGGSRKAAHPALDWWLLLSLQVLFWVSALVSPPFVESSAIGGADGVCNLFAFVPFTIEYVPFVHHHRRRRLV
jgi:hypothetical protein